jgi:hypothetical protein
MAYIPYCDVFRTDDASSKIAGQLAGNYGTAVVKHLDELLDSIHRVSFGRQNGKTA